MLSRWLAQLSRATALARLRMVVQHSKTLT